MKKTMYIPRGQEMRLETLTCERLVVDGSLHVNGDILAKRVCGKGFLNAHTISAESITADTITAGTVVTDRLIAARVSAVEVHAVQSMAVSSFIQAGYVKAGKVTVADAEIEDLDADEVVKLTAKRRGLLGTLLASFVRSKWTALTCRDTKKSGGQTNDAVEDAPVFTEAETEASDGNNSVEMTSEMAEAVQLMSDPEFLRLKAMYRLTRETGDIWQLVQKTESTDRAVTLAHQFTKFDEKAA